MAENSRLLRTLRLISETSRKFKNTTPTTHLSPAAPTIPRSLPKHKPLLPLLLSHGIPSKLAKACADRYDRYANQLRSDTEIKLAPYLVHRRKNPPARVYPVFLENYNQALRNCAQSILNATLKHLERGSADIRDWDVTHLPPFWLPISLDQQSTSTHGVPRNSWTLCQSPGPPHAFPTTYPPPFRPSSETPPVEWRRTPATSSNVASTSTIDVDSLCAQFSKLLVIDKHSARPSENCTSIFSLPAISKSGDGVTSSHTIRARRRRSQIVACPKLPTLNSTLSSPSRVTKHRQLSVPPSLPSLTLGHNPVPRKANAPACISTPSFPPTATPRITLTTGNLDPNSFHSQTTPPLCPQLLPDSTPGRPSHSRGNSLQFLTGPATPPTLPPDLFPEPLVVPSTPIQLSPQHSIAPIIYPLNQFQLQYDCFFTPPLVSPFDNSGMMIGLPKGSFSSKDADTPLWSDHSFHCIPTTESSEIDFFNINSVF